jgi:hypothetical protein
MTKFIVRSIVVLFTVSLLAGCVSTPASRIKKNAALFGSFPAEAQALIEKGEVAIGFTPEMVEMSKDKPNRKYDRTTSAGTIEVWSYTGIYTTTDRQQVQTRVRAPDASGSYRTYTDWVWVDVQQQHEYDQIRIEFTDGKVSAIENLRR